MRNAAVARGTTPFASCVVPVSSIHARQTASAAARAPSMRIRTSVAMGPF